jgi:hypothetical protein
MKRAAAPLLLLLSSCGGDPGPLAAPPLDDRAALMLGPHHDIVASMDSVWQLEVAAGALLGARQPAPLVERIEGDQVTGIRPWPPGRVRKLRELLLDPASYVHGLLASEAGAHVGVDTLLLWAGESVTRLRVLPEGEGIVLGLGEMAFLGARLTPAAFARLARLRLEP